MGRGIARADAASIDIVVPVAPKDLPKLRLCLEHLRKNCLDPIRRIFIVCDRRGPVWGVIDSHDVGYVDENTAPFSIAGIDAKREAKVEAIGTHGWFFQQLLKLYVFRMIPEALSKVLVVDSDFLFLRPLHFVDGEGRGILAHGYPFAWKPGAAEIDLDAEVRRFLAARGSERGGVSLLYGSYIDAAEHVLPGWQVQGPYTGMHHHVLFERELLSGLLDEAERVHGRAFWEIFCGARGPSEYCLYYHHVRQRHPGRVSTRHLRSVDFAYNARVLDPLLSETAALAERGETDCVGLHSHQKDPRRLGGVQEVSGRPLRPIETVRLELRDGILDVGLAELALREGTLREGAPLDPRLIPRLDPSLLSADELLVVFLDAASALCQRWLDVLKVVARRADLPQVVAVFVSLSEEERARLERERFLNYPTASSSPAEIDELIGAYPLPAAAHVRGGIVHEIWAQLFPESFIARLREGDLSYYA